MIKLVRQSSNSKTGPIAVTYRSGSCNTYGTCPNTCELNPAQDRSAQVIDLDYLASLRRAVPRAGQAWTYSHFAAELLPVPRAGETVINVSADTPDQAIHAWGLGRPATVTAPIGADLSRPITYKGVRLVHCPEQSGHVDSCMNCGNGRPLCARAERDYIIVFSAHGTGARKVSTKEKGGCYAGYGHVAIQWHGIKKQAAPALTDGELVEAFARSLPPGSLLRHHIAGDTGKDQANG